MTTINKSDLRSAFYTMLTCGVLLLFLLLMIMPKPEILTKDEGIMVSLGLDIDGFGEAAPSGLGTPQEIAKAEDMPSVAASEDATQITSPDNVPAASPTDDIATQEAESAATIDAQRKAKIEQDRIVRERERLRQEEIDRQRRQAVIEAEQKAKADQARSLATNAFGGAGTPSGTGGTGGGNAGMPGGSGENGPGGYGAGGTSKGQGTTIGETISGNPLGKGNAGGHSFSLCSRTMRSQFFAPPYNSNEEGRIVVDIRVDDSGNVTSATIAKGTNITDNQLRNVTLEAARKIKFTSATGGTAMGTITYNFSLR